MNDTAINGCFETSLCAGHLDLVDRQYSGNLNALVLPQDHWREETADSRSGEATAQGTGATTEDLTWPDKLSGNSQL